MSHKICVYQNFFRNRHREQLRKAAGEVGFELGLFEPDQLEAAKAYVQDPECEILLSISSEVLRAAPATLKWFAIPWAGVDEYSKDLSWFANPDCLVTNSNCYGVNIAEHVIMVLLMLLRRMPEYEAFVQERNWTRVRDIRSIKDGEFTILGTGNIAANVSSCLRGMGAAKVTALNRSGRATQGEYDEVLPISRLDEILPQTRILILALPSTPETYHILNRERIALLPKDALVMNVGRGTAIEQEPLIEALESGSIAGAGLDVVDPEPLPKEHVLWNTKNLILTPHVSGDMSLPHTQDAVVNLFCGNIKNFANGRPLKGQVQLKRGY